MKKKRKPKGCQTEKSMEISRSIDTVQCLSAEDVFSQPLLSMREHMKKKHGRYPYVLHRRERSRANGNAQRDSRTDGRMGQR